MKPPAVDVKEIFGNALELPDPEEVASYLDRACAGDSKLRAEVEELLRAEQAAGSFLDAPAIPETSLFQHEPPDLGESLDDYKLLEKIGEGGFGTIFMAEQTAPIRRTVAVKLLRPGMATKEVLTRFEVERQSLALMDHPNIAKVLDAGTTKIGRPYFAMELVRGISITQHCDQARLTNRQRLELFVDVCRAVQHAHLKGIIHRDLKPNNIMVTMHDSKAVVKVIDFGIAKALDQQLTEHTLFTGYHQVLGTPLYMSPEQTQMNGIDIDTRSDIYSLGVVLYELMTGTTPFDKSTLAKAGLDEWRRIIREDDPPRPSQRVTTMEAEAISTVADCRRLDHRRMSEQLRGELDWIIMRTLEKDRTRRYESASDLAADIQRYLADEPVQACPPSNWYKTSKWIRRHRVLVTSVGIIALTLAAGLVGTATQAVRAIAAERLAKQRFDNERLARLQAEQQSARANIEAERADRAAALARENAAAAVEEASIATAISDFLQEDILAHSEIKNQIDAGYAADPNITLATLLDRAAERIGDRFSELPVVEGSLRFTLAQAYMALEKYPSAEPHIERAVAIGRNIVGAKQPGTLRAVGVLGMLRLRQTRLAEAETLLTEAYNGLLSLEQAEETVNDEDLIGALGNLVVLRHEQGNYEHAKELCLEMLERCTESAGAEHPTTLAVMHNLSLQYVGLGQLDSAEALAQQTLEIRQRTLGPSHPDTLASVKSLAIHYDRQQNHLEAFQLFEQVLDGYRELYGPQHPLALGIQSNLGHVLHRLGRNTESEELLVDTLQELERQLGVVHPTTLITQSYLSTTLRANGKFDEALALSQKALETQTERLGPQHPDVLETKTGCAECLRKLGRIEEAEAYYREAIQTAHEVLGREHPIALTYVNNLGVLYFDARQFPEALEQFELVRAARNNSSEQDAAGALSVAMNIASVLEELGRSDEAIEIFRDTVDRIDVQFGSAHGLAIAARVRLAKALKSTTPGPPQFDQSARIYREILDITSTPTSAGAHSSVRLSALVELGEVLNAQLEHSATGPGATEAERVLLEAVNRTTPPAGKSLKMRHRALTQLVDLYERQQRFSEAAVQQGSLLAHLREHDAERTAQHLTAMLRLARLLTESEQYDEARALFVEVTQFRDCSSLSRLSGYRGLFELHLAQDDFGEALKAVESCSAFVASESLGGEDESLRAMEVTNQLQLAHVQRLQGHWAEAEARLDSMLDRLQTQPNSQYMRVRVQLALAQNWFSQGERDKAKELYSKLIADIATGGRPTSRLSLEAQLGLASILVAQEDFDAAAEELQGVVELDEEPSRDWRYYCATSLLGECWLAAGKYDEAEKVLRDGYSGLQDTLLIRAVSGVERRQIFAEASGRLIKLCEATSQTEELAHWQAEHAKWLDR